MKLFQKCYKVAPNFTYELFTLVNEPSGKEVEAKLYLYNKRTGELECHSVRKKGESYVISLPTGENGEMQDYDVVTTFNINPVVFSERREWC